MGIPHKVQWKTKRYRSLANIDNHDLDIKSIKHIYKECHAFGHVTFRIKTDKGVNAALDSKLGHEIQWSRKNYISLYFEATILMQLKYSQIKKTPM